ncbi:hypothetical protein EC973_009030 [Apophysomyces ossiformis]|uniref:FAD-binding domain-containing protein n=1 Tax=Apophysomyces ossiformis TaxID=679940 RepID=A0A8H7EPE4_9FUNG|nr:hypothetical protein EC973_009030 [Apophysomyces ossiformis]
MSNVTQVANYTRKFNDIKSDRDMESVTLLMRTMAAPRLGSAIASNRQDRFFLGCTFGKLVSVAKGCVLRRLLDFLDMVLDKPVIIIGAGVAGLSLAQVLQHKGVPFKVFERDPGSDYRSQGRSMSLHFCLQALKQAIGADYYESMPRKSSVNTYRPTDYGFALIDGKTQRTMIRVDHDVMKAMDLEAYRINRVRFRKWLLEGINIEWAKRFSSFKVIDNGIQVKFTDGTIVDGSILVGADGVNSAVCQQLMGSDKFTSITKVNPLYTLIGMRWVDEDTRNQFAKLSPTQFYAYGRMDNGEMIGMFVSLNDVDPSRQDEYQMMWCISRYDERDLIPKPESDSERLDQAKAWASEAFEGLIRSLVCDTPPGTLVSRLKIREREPHAIMNSDTLGGRLTLIGDAAHPMTNFRGEGGNHAILDAILLANALSDAHKGKNSLAEAVRTYQEEMVPRGRSAVIESDNAVKLMHTSPNGMLEAMKALYVHPACKNQ